MKKVKLWKVTVNNWGWDTPRTYYFQTREEAQQAYDSAPAADPVQYAGLFTEENAQRLCGNWLPE